VARALESHVGRGGLDAACVFGARGELEASAGDPAEIAAIHVPPAPYGEATRDEHGARGRALDIVVPVDDAVVVARMSERDAADHAAPLVRLVALYMITFALALLTFAYFALTRLIVRPVDTLVRAADRVASGARALTVPQAGARELSDLATSLQAMTTRLMADEAALRAKVDELTQTTRRLTATQTQLVKSDHMASVGRLAAGIAHEVGNPIAAILGMEELLLDGDLAAAEQRDFVRRMKKETERIHTVIRDLLDFARPERAQEAGAAAEPAEIHTVVGDVFALLKPQKAFKGIALESDLEDDGLLLSLSPQRLTQVLLNVLLNAAAAIASRSGGATERDAVTVRARREPGGARIEVDDTGPGIPDDMHLRIFEPFVTTKEVGEGTGLGLSVCRGLVESVGGTIAIDPSYTRGARVVIRLPTIT
jgi:signal transduction histidine kinase